MGYPNSNGNYGYNKGGNYNKSGSSNQDQKKAKSKESNKAMWFFLGVAVGIAVVLMLEKFLL